MIELLLTIVVLGLASYRITRFLVLDTLIGMGTTTKVVDMDVVEEPNSPLAGVVWRFAYNDDGSDRNFLRGKIGDLLGCPFCLGAWVSFAAWALWTWSLPWQPGVEFQHWWVCAFAVAGVQSYVSSRQDA